MRILERLFPDLGRERQKDLPKLAAMMGLYFLVVLAVGILRPIKNALALDGLALRDFYQVYIVSAAVVVFIPPYNRLSERVPWRWLMPGVAIFFALNLLLFWRFYVDGSATYGMVFYGWYDLFSAGLAVQFFMTTQMLLNARAARQAYPLVIAGGAIGASLGGLVNALLAERLGTPNLLIIAAFLVGIFALALPFAWPDEDIEPVRERRRQRERVNAAGFGEVFANPHVRLIAATVLLAIIVKQLVDYQFQTMTKMVYVDRDSITAFQGTFNAATQWIPLVVLAGLRPALSRWGVGVAVLTLPIFMVAGNVALGIAFTLGTAVFAKGAETSLRYSAERVGREILYVPVPERLKLKAKVYIDVAVEKGGKVVAAALIPILFAVGGSRGIAVAGAVLALGWLVAAVAVRREYVETLSRAIQGRFASLSGGFAPLSDASTRGIVEEALASGDLLHTNFALDMLEQAGPADVRPLASSVSALLDHGSRDVRARALRVLARVPDQADPERIRARLEDPSVHVREAAVRAVTARADDVDAVLRELLSHPSSGVRRATLACMARAVVEVEDPASVGGWYLEHREIEAEAGDVEARIEMALAAGALRNEPGGRARLLPYLEDDDARVRSAALESAGLMEDPWLLPEVIAALRDRPTREAARNALLRQGGAAVEALAEALNDVTGDPLVRRQIPRVLARIPTQRTVDALLESFLMPETDQLLDYRALKALSVIRREHPELDFDRQTVLDSLEREVDAAARYLRARRALEPYDEGREGVTILRRALYESWEERRETAFRCLGLLFDADAMYRCHLTLTIGDFTARGNALEWLEQTIGHGMYHGLEPVLHDQHKVMAEPPLLRLVLGELLHDNDTWLGRCAVRAAVDLGIRLPAPPAVLAWPHEPDEPRMDGMDLIEKVFLLQQVDLLRDARNAHLALLGSIAEEVEVSEGTTLLERGDPTDALYLVVQGAVEVEGVGGQIMTARDGMPFGTWALIDEAPSLVGATTLERTRLLRIARADFYDLLADHPELAMGMLQGLARRVRTLVA